ncbi:hypothetical protein P4S64_21650 [Vibrio sp. M60_M31a]
MAVPVFNRGGKLRSTLNVSCHSSKTTVDKDDQQSRSFSPEKDAAQHASLCPCRSPAEQA